MITNPTAAPTLQDWHRQCEVDDYDLPLRSCLGARCCDWCGRPMGLVRQTDGTYKQRCNCGG